MRTNSEIIDIIIKICDENGISMSELARRTGMAKSAISRYFNKTREFPLNRADEFSKALNINTEYLLGINTINALYRDEKEEDLVNNYRVLSKEGKHTLVTYSDALVKEENNKVKEDTELYSVEVTEAVAAGIGYHYSNNNSTLYYTDRDDVKDYDYATLVEGDSMEPLYHDGDIILVKAGYDHIHGGIYVVDYDGKSFVKKLYNDGDRFRLVSTNRKYEPIIVNIPIEGDTYFNIVGKVVDSFTPIKK